MDSLKQLFANVAVRVAAAILSILGGLSAIGWFVSQIHRWLSTQLIDAQSQPSSGTIKLAAGLYEISYWFVFIFLTLLTTLIIILIAEFAVWSDTRRISDQERLKVLHEYTRLGESIKKIVRALYNPTNPSIDGPPRFNFRSIDCKFKTNERGDTEVTQEYVIETKAEAGQFWRVLIEGDSFAKKWVALSDISFRSESLTPACSLETVPTSVSGDNKEIVLFFLPEVPPNSNRAFRVSYSWKGWFGELFYSTLKQTNWTWSYACRDPDDIASVRFEFSFDAGCGQINCENMKPAVPGEVITQTTDAVGRTVWTYEAKNAPVGRLDWDLKFSKLR